MRASTQASKRSRGKIQRQCADERSFFNVAKIWHSAKAKQWDAEHAEKLWRSLELHIFPHIGDRPINDIKPREILDAIHKIEKANKVLKNIFPNTKQELIEQCIPPSEASSAWHKKVWSMCDYEFEDKDLYIWIKFRGGVYSPEDIETTKELILDQIRQYHIK